jgi:hypothetical protein
MRADDDDAVNRQCIAHLLLTVRSGILWVPPGAHRHPHTTHTCHLNKLLLCLLGGMI